MNKRARWATRAMCPRTFWDGFTHKNPPHKPGPDCFDSCEFTDIAGPGDICICKACNPHRDAGALPGTRRAHLGPAEGSA